MGAALLAALPRVAGTLGSVGRIGSFMAGFGTGRQEESDNPSLGIPGEAPMMRQTY